MACISEGEVPVSALQYQLTSSEDDAGITARLAKKLIAWASLDAGKLEVIRPGTFTAQYIRSTGLKAPVLIKGDRFNESPQLGLMWPDVHNISVDVLSDYIGGDRKVDTWDVMKQRPGPAWTLSQWCTYWHARLDAATRQAKPATAHGAPGMLVNDDDDEEGEVVDSGVVIVLQGVQGAPHSRYNPAPACVGISPEQAQRLLDGECLPLHGSQLCQHIHPPPAIQSVDLVRQVEKDLEMLFPARREGAAAGNGPAKSDLARGGAAPERERETSRDGVSSTHGPRRNDSDKGRVFPALAINPADTLHLQMTPKDCFSDFRMAPGGAATWLYVLQGVKVVVLLPPTLRNRRLFLTWATATRANQPKENVLVECLLADYAEGGVKVELKASQALVIPAGWFYASAATTDTLAVGCYLWHPYCLADTARAQQMELQLKLKPQRFTLPAQNLLWYAGIAYCCKLRKEFGLQDLLLRKDTPGSARRSVSEASLNQQQQRASPYLRGMAGPAAAAAGSEQQQRRRLVRNAGGSVTPGSTPPLFGVHAAGQQQQEGVGNGLGALMVAKGKRGRQSDVMEHLFLGDSAVPVAATAAEAGQQQQPAKRIKLATGKPTTPLLVGMTGGAAVSAPHSAAAGHHNAAAGPVPSSSNHSGRPQQQHQQQMCTPRRGGQHRYAAAVMDDDDDDECHTSPVRRLEPEPVDHVAAAAGAGASGHVDWGVGHAFRAAGQQPKGNGTAAEPSRPITALKIRVPGKAQPMYSPVIQPLKGDLDSIPLLSEQQQQPVVTPPAAAARKAAAMASGLLPPPAAAATPGRKKLTIKGQSTPTAAAAAAAADAVWPQGSPVPATAAGQQQQVRRRSSPDQDSSAGSHAVASEATHGTNASSGLQQQQLLQGQAAAAARGQQQQQRKMVLELVSDDEDDVQQQQQQQQQQPILAPPTQQRRPSEPKPSRPPSAAAAAAAAPAAKAGPPLKLKFKLASPSPKLAALQAPQSGPEAPPALSLDGQPAAAVAVQQQQQRQQQGQAAVIPQIDGAVAATPWQQGQQGQAAVIPQTGGSGQTGNSWDSRNLEAAVLQGQYAMQQLRQRQAQQPVKCLGQAGLWVRWQQLKSSMHAGQQHQCAAAAAAGDAIPQVDGATEDGRPAIGGPTLVLQPAAPAAAAPVSKAAAAANGLQPLGDLPSHHVGHISHPAMTAAGGGGGVPAAVGLLSPGKAQQQQQQVQLRSVAHTAAKPPTVKQQQQQQTTVPAVLRNHHTAVTPGVMHQQQPAVPAAAAAAAGLNDAAAQGVPGQQGLVIARNPVLQPQVQKLKQAVAGRTPSPPESASPRDKGITAAAAAAEVEQQQQQQGGGLITAAAAKVPQQQSMGPAGTIFGVQGPLLQYRDSVGFRQGVAEVAITAHAAAGAAGDQVCSTPVAGCSRVGSSSLPALISPPAAAAAGAGAAGHILPTRRSSVGIMGDSTAPAQTAAAGLLPRVSPPPFHATVGTNSFPPSQQQQQQGNMGPPPPTKLSGWEVLELPMLVDLLQEQVSERMCEIQQVVPGLDAELVVQQLQEAVAESKRHRDEEQQQQALLQLLKPQQQRQQQVGVAVIDVDMLQQQADSGPLVVLPLSQTEMQPGFWDHVRTGQQLLRANGALLGHGMGDMAPDISSEHVGEHDPDEGSLGATSLDNRSAGSIGGSRGVAAGRAAAAAAGGAVGRVLQHHQVAKRGAVPLGVQQAKNIKKQQIMKGIGIKR